MPVTTKPAHHDANKWSPHRVSAASSEDLFKLSCTQEHSKMIEMIASSFPDVSKQSSVFPMDNGFVYGAISAYNQHHHLVIRPEDVWFAILTQLSYYINAHAEELRGQFVAHEGQKQLVAVQMATLRTADYGRLAYDMGHIIQKNIVDPELREWMMPAFTTTVKTDEVVASVIMMGSMQKYFKYCMRLLCGLPSVTLLGEKSDWVKMLHRIEKLRTFGKEPSVWHSLLEPVLKRFVQTFDSPDSKATKDFWQKIAHHTGGGSGPRYLSGWITAFCFWNGDGKPLYVAKDTPESRATISNKGDSVFRLDRISYHRLDTNDIPIGFTAVPVEIDDNGTKYPSRMVAGSIGVTVTSSGVPIKPVPPPSGIWNWIYNTAGPSASSSTAAETDIKNTVPVLDTVQPLTGWWIYVVRDEEEEEEAADKRQMITNK